MGEMQNPALDPWSGRARFSSDRTSKGPKSQFQTRSKGPEQLEVGKPLSLNLLAAYKLVKKQPVLPQLTVKLTFAGRLLHALSSFYGNFFSSH